MLKHPKILIRHRVNAKSDFFALRQSSSKLEFMAVLAYSAINLPNPPSCESWVFNGSFWHESSANGQHIWRGPTILGTIIMKTPCLSV